MSKKPEMKQVLTTLVGGDIRQDYEDPNYNHNAYQLMSFAYFADCANNNGKPNFQKLVAVGT